MKEAKYATVSVRKHQTDKWIASFPYVAGFTVSGTDAEGNETKKPVWKTKRRVLKTKGRDKGRSKRIESAAKLEAEELRKALNEEAAKEEAVRAASVTVAEYVGRFIEENSGSVEATTVSGYRTLLSRSISPYIGGKELGQLDADTVAAWVANLSKDKSKATARKALVLLRSALTVAVMRGLIPSNPTDTVKKPKTEKANPNALGEAERGRVAAFVEIQPDDSVSIAIRLALYTGMREAEICGLRWRSVDIEAGTLKVVESLGKARKDDIRRFGERVEVYSGVYLKRPKNDGSVRTITYPASVARALKSRRAAMQAECMAAGIPFNDSLFVCGTVDGKPMHPHNLWRRWNGLVTAMGLVGTQGKTPTFHDLRHTYATAAIAGGIDVKTVSNQMGHSNAAMTLNTYASVDPDAARRAADKMGEMLGADVLRAQRAGEVLELGKTGTEC
ncbi:tyrosine-type recombinase/integrase [Collinsella tanakaei]|nr:tyrosine-type recombinase/integrase [Collinsella tanakaei]